MTLTELPSQALLLALVLARVGALVMMLPGISETEVPPMPRAGFALALALLLLPSAAPRGALADDAAALLRALVIEVAIGLWIGWLARVAVLALQTAGQMASMATGLTNVLQPDALMGGQGSAMGRAFALAGPLLVLTTGLHEWPLRALAGSYSWLPVGGQGALPWQADEAVAAVGGSFAIALAVSGPLVVLSLVWHVGLALASRLVPQLQVFLVAAPGQILGGLIALSLAAGAMLVPWLQYTRDVFAMLPGL